MSQPVVLKDSKKLISGLLKPKTMNTWILFALIFFHVLKSFFRLTSHHPTSRPQRWSRRYCQNSDAKEAWKCSWVFYATYIVIVRPISRTWLHPDHRRPTPWWKDFEAQWSRHWTRWWGWWRHFRWSWACKEWWFCRPHRGPTNKA